MNFAFRRAAGDKYFGRKCTRNAAKILDTFDSRDSAGDKSPLSHRKFNMLIPRSQRTLNAPHRVFRTHRWSQWTIVRARTGKIAPASYKNIYGAVSCIWITSKIEEISWWKYFSGESRSAIAHSRVY